MRRHKWVELLCVGLAVVPMLGLLTWHAFESRNRFESHHLTFHAGVLVAGSLIAVFSYIWLFRPRALASKLLGFLYSAAPALLIGVAFASSILALYFAFPSGGFDSYWERFEGAVAIVFSTVGVSVAVYELHRRTAPFTDVRSLLHHIGEDLRDARFRALIAYPALNIGYYRYHKKAAAGGLPSSGEWDEEWLRSWVDPLHQVAQAREVTVTTITYEEADIEKLYRVYVDGMHKEGKEKWDDDRRANAIQACVESARDLLAKMKNKTSHVHRCSPSGFPPHVIIVDDVVYFISSFGLPQWNGDAFCWPGEDGSVEHSRAVLFAYRREDAALANVVERQVKMYVSGPERGPPGAAEFEATSDEYS